MNSSNDRPASAPPRIAIQGAAGAFHEIAARRYHHHRDIAIVPMETFEDLVRSVERGHQSDGGMMAIENSIAGSLLYNYQLLDEADLHISGEVYLRIRHQLLALPGQSIADLREVHSHPMAIAQCRPFFRKHPHIRLVERNDTAGSARWVSDGEHRGVGAIASTLAGEQYGLEVIAPGIETNKKNYTRFLVLDHGPSQLDHPGAKVSVCLTTSHEPGSLHCVLEALLRAGANLTKIQSMPIIGQEWHYRFFIDFTLADPLAFGATVDHLGVVTEDLKILGTYQTGAYHDS
ncbi:MAG: prephenate dehydratase [Bacteroidota bacterium]